mgnify:CR=1 FL=1
MTGENTLGVLKDFIPLVSAFAHAMLSLINLDSHALFFCYYVEPKVSTFFLILISLSENLRTKSRCFNRAID